MDLRLVSTASRCEGVLLRKRQRRRTRKEPRSSHAGHPASPQSSEGRFLSVRGELLLALPPGSTHSPAGGYRNRSPGFSLHRAKQIRPSTQRRCEKNQRRDVACHVSLL